MTPVRLSGILDVPMDRPRRNRFFFGPYLKALLIAGLALEGVPFGTVPAFALRQVGLEENEKLRNELANQLRSPYPQPRFQKPAAGLEEVTAEEIKEKMDALAREIQRELEKIREQIGLLVDFQPLREASAPSYPMLEENAMKAIQASWGEIEKAQGSFRSQNNELGWIVGHSFNKALSPLLGFFELMKDAGVKQNYLEAMQRSVESAADYFSQLQGMNGEELLDLGREVYGLNVRTPPPTASGESPAGLEEVTVEAVRRVAQEYHQKIQGTLEAIRRGLESKDQGAVARAAKRIRETSFNRSRSTPLHRLVYETLKRELTLLLRSLEAGPNTPVLPAGEEAFGHVKGVLEELESLSSFRVIILGSRTCLLLDSSAFSNSSVYSPNLQWLDDEAKALGADRVFVLPWRDLAAGPPRATLYPYWDLVQKVPYEERLERYFQEANEEFRKEGVEIEFKAPTQLYIMQGETPGRYDFVIYDGEFPEDRAKAGYPLFRVGEVLRMHPFLLAKKVLDPELDLELLLGFFKGTQVKKVELSQEKDWVILFASSRSA